MRRAARAAALAGALMAGCATTRPGAARLPPREAEPGCVAGGVHVTAPAEGQPASWRATVEFWVEADGSPGPIQAASWAEGLGLEGQAELANQVALAVARCRWVAGTVDGRPVRALVRLPLRFAPSEEAEPEAAAQARSRAAIRSPREEVPGCVPRALPLPGASSGAVSRGTFLVAVEADGSRGAVALAGRADLDPEQRRALVEAVAGASAPCRFLAGTVDGQPARTFWLVEIGFTGPAGPPAGPSP